MFENWFLEIKSSVYGLQPHEKFRAVAHCSGNLGCPKAAENVDFFVFLLSYKFGRPPSVMVKIVSWAESKRYICTKHFKPTGQTVLDIWVH